MAVLTSTPRPPGRFTLFCGPMFAGKTTALLAQHRGVERDWVLKPASDDRYFESRVATHDGDSVLAYNVNTSEERWWHWPILDGWWRERVLIDEVQFFPPDVYDRLIAPLLAYGVDVYAAGLDMDARGLTFGPMKTLLIEADSLVHLTARCDCGAPAAYTSRTAPGPLSVGGAESYAPRCFEHWTPFTGP